MNARERALFTDLVGALTERFTGAGHVKQQIEEEHRGHCPARGCTDTCRDLAGLLIDASLLLQAELEGNTLAEVAG